MNPIQTIQKTIFATQQVGAWHIGDAQHLARAGSRGQPVEVQPHEQRSGRSVGRGPPRRIPREDDGGRDEPRHEQHERAGKVAPRLGERFSNLLNHRDLTLRPTSCSTSTGFSRRNV